jgi:hypothetical protein
MIRTRWGALTGAVVLGVIGVFGQQVRRVTGSLS